MELPKDDAVNSLVEFKKGELGSKAAFDVLSNVRSENLWLANFSSQNTRDSYKRSVASFIATLGITSPDELYDVKQAHVLAWRASLENADLSQTTIASRRCLRSTNI